MHLIDTIHVIFLLYPFSLLLLPNVLLFGYQYIFLIQMLTPLHWIFLDNKCILSNLSNNNLKKKKKNKLTNCHFSEKYLWWLYDPMCKLLKYEKNDLSYSKVINIHLGCNLIIMWYYTFFVYFY